MLIVFLLFSKDNNEKTIFKNIIIHFYFVKLIIINN